METILGLIKSMLPNLLTFVIVPVAAVLGSMAGILLKKIISSIDDEKFRSAADTVVRYVEKTYNASSTDKSKFTTAFDALKETLNIKNIDASKAKVYIEAAVKNLDLETKKKSIESIQVTK